MPVAIVFGSILLIVIAALGYSAWYQNLKFKHRDRARGGIADASNSVGLSELSGVIRSAVQDATAPIEERLDAIEGGLKALRASGGEGSRKSLPEASSERLLELAEEDPEEDEALVDARRRVR